MSTKDLHRRLDRIEARHHHGDPVTIMADRPMSDAEGATALSNWRRLVAEGTATVTERTLWILEGQLPSAEEWTKEHARESSYLQ